MDSLKKSMGYVWGKLISSWGKLISSWGKELEPQGTLFFGET